MEYLIYVFIIAFSVFQSASVKFYNKADGDGISFNIIKSISALVLLCLFSVNGLVFHIETFVYAVFYGASLAVSMYSGYKALSAGPLALTSMIVSFSVVIPVLFGFVFYSEAINLIKIFGLILFVFAIVFTNIKKDGKNSEKIEKSWIFYVVLTFLTNGICSVLQKVHQVVYPEQYTKEFMLFSFVFCSIIFAFISIFRKTEQKKEKKKGIIFACIAGAFNAIVNFLTLTLAGLENASVLFPTISVGTILGTLILGAVLFKEKLEQNQYIAFVCGLLAIFCLKM